MNSQDILIQNYMKTFSEKDKKAYEIAKSHLGMTFQIEKSIGYIEWLKTQENKSNKE